MRHCAINLYIKNRLTPVNCFGMCNPTGNFFLFRHITKSVLKSSVNADGHVKFYPGKQKQLIVKA